MAEMKKAEIDLLKQHIDNGIVFLQCKDGEQITARVLSVSETEQDVICDILSTSHPDRYSNGQIKDAHLIHFSEIDNVREATT